MAEKMNTTEQIKHFLKLAEDKGATQAERDLASAQAERLILKHQIDRASLVDQDEDDAPEAQVYWIYGGKSSYSMDKFRSLKMVVDAMGGQVLLMDYRVGAASRITPLKRAALGMQIFAMASDLPAIMQLISSLDTQSTIAMNAWWKSNPMREYYQAEGNQAVFDQKHEFYRGFGRGAAERIREELARGIEAAKTTAPGAGLVLVERATLVRQAADAMSGGPVKNRARFGDGSGTRAGHAAGYEAAAGRSRGQAALGR